MKKYFVEMNGNYLIITNEELECMKGCRVIEEVVLIDVKEEKEDGVV